MKIIAICLYIMCVSLCVCILAFGADRVIETSLQTLVSEFVVLYGFIEFNNEVRKNYLLVYII